MAAGSPPSPFTLPSAPSSSSPLSDGPNPSSSSAAAALSPSTPSPPPPQAGATTIAFFDVETTIPSRAGQGYALLEFGAILVCPRRLVELGSYSTLIRPRELSAISPASVRCNGITRESVATAPDFEQVADRVYDVLHGKVWAGHNILRFDCLRIREAFEEIGRPPPEPIGTIDSLPLLTQRFGRRAGDMKMATLANYFGLGRQKHRSLDDVRMNLEVLKYCATVLFLESSLLESATASSVFANAPTKRCSRTVSPEGLSPGMTSLILENPQRASPTRDINRMDVCGPADISEPASDAGPSDLTPLIEQMRLDVLSTDILLDGRQISDLPQLSSEHDSPSDHWQDHGFLEPVQVSISCISSRVVPSSRWGNRIVMLHGNTPLQLQCIGMKVHFGVSTKFLDHAGRPKLSIVVNAPASLCSLLDACDSLAKQSSLGAGSNSEWRPTIRKSCLSDSSIIRLHMPTVANGDVATYSTEIYQKEPSGNAQKLVFSNVDAAELVPLFVPGTILDAYFYLDIYDYRQYAGMRLVAKRLVIHPR